MYEKRKGFKKLVEVMSLTVKEFPNIKVASYSPPFKPQFSASEF